MKRILYLFAVLCFASRTEAGAADLSKAAGKGKSAELQKPLTDAELFERLNLSHTGLEKVRAAVEANNLEQAKVELVSYYRARRLPRFFDNPDSRPKPNASYNTAKADQVMKHVFTFLNYTPQQVGEKIDWEARPFGGFEWPANLHRHSVLTQLSQAWFYTDDDRYARELETLLSDWIKSTKAPDEKAYDLWWHTLNTGSRVGHAWPMVWYQLRDCDAFSPGARVAMLKSYWMQAEYLREHPYQSSNPQILGGQALVTAGILFSEFRRATDWKAEGWKRLTEEIQVQTYPDGAHYELAAGYHLTCIKNFYNAVKLAELNKEEEVPPDFRKRLEKMYEYAAFASKPNRTLPMLNDSSRPEIDKQMHDAARLFHRGDFEYLASDGKKGTAPTPTSLAFPYAGQYVMRTGWDRNALYCLMDAGPFGFASHHHEDKLNLDIHAYGEDLIIDPGIFQYGSRAPMVTFFRWSSAHNLVLVDGLGQHRGGRPRETFVAKEPLSAPWESGDSFDYVRGKYDEGFADKADMTITANVTHKRAVLFIKPHYWVVCDFITANDARAHSYDWLWHFAPGKATQENGRVVFKRGKAGIAVTTTLPAPPILVEGSENPPQGWVSYVFGKKEPAPVAIYKTKGENLAVITVLYPFAGATPPEVTLLTPALEAESAGVVVARPGGRDVVLFRRTAGQSVKCGDMTTDGEAACVRLDEGGKVTKAFRYGGTFLRRGQEDIVH